MSTQWTLGKFYVNTCLLSINLVPGLYVGPEKKESQSLYSSSHLAVGETGSASERDGPVHLSAKGLRTPHLHLRSPSPGTASFGDEPAPRDACSCPSPGEHGCSLLFTEKARVLSLRRSLMEPKILGNIRLKTCLWKWCRI
ncbi:hypothetical protein VULLAG_LOCUS1996 [Vulpes lagopus]